MLACDEMFWVFCTNFLLLLFSVFIYLLILILIIASSVVVFEWCVYATTGNKIQGRYGWNLKMNCSTANWCHLWVTQLRMCVDVFGNRRLFVSTRYFEFHPGRLRCAVNVTTPAPLREEERRQHPFPPWASGELHGLAKVQRPLVFVL